MRRFVFPAAAAVAFVGLFAGTADAQPVRYVRADATPGGNGLSWATAFRDVQQALATSAPGTSVWVARGSYRPPGGAGIQLFPNVSIYGGFVGNETSFGQRDSVANPTFLSGDMNGDDDIGGTTFDNVLVIFAPNNILANTVVDGFTIRSGRSPQGGALRCAGGSPTFRNCHFTRNDTDFVGANGSAVYIGANGPSCSPRFINCRFTRNGSLISSSGVFLADGFGVDVRVVGCSFTGNSTSNQGIVGVRNGAGMSLVNSAVVANTLHGQGAVVLQPGNPASMNIINCTIAGNTNLDGGSTGGVAVLIPTTPILIRNTVLWGNVCPGVPTERAQFALPGGSPFRLDYCRVQGWTGQFMGTGTSSADPMLMDLDGPDDLPASGDEDVHLLPGSSCIDAGNNNYVWPDIADVDGDGNFDEPTPQDLGGLARFLDDPATTDTGVGTPPIVDIGAYERPGASQPCNADFNHDGFVNSQDLFDFLGAFFKGCP